MRASDISNEGLAAILRAIAFTSRLTTDEKDYINETADRLENLQEKEDYDEKMLLLRDKEV